VRCNSSLSTVIGYKQAEETKLGKTKGRMSGRADGQTDE